MPLHLSSQTKPKVMVDSSKCQFMYEPHFEARTRLRFSFSLLHHTVIDTLSVLRFIVSFQDDRDERQFILQLTLSRFPVIF